MKVLIACEYSGIVRDAFLALGHDTISCDLLPTDAPGPHYQGDVFDMLDEEWDLIIAHPPCTYLTVAGNRHYGEGKDKHHMRLEAAAWTQKFWDACKRVCKKVAFENPVSVLARLTNMPKAKYVQPYQHGHLEQKKTGLHLHGLDPITPTNDVYEEMMKLPRREREKVHFMSPSPDRWKLRSTTYPGIANAMAEQWGQVVLGHEGNPTPSLQR